MNRLKHLREERARIEGEMRSIFVKCENEKRSRTAEESTQYNSLKSQVDGIDSEIKDLEELEAREARSAKPVGEKPVEQRAGVKKPTNVRESIEAFVEANRDTIEAIRRGEQRSLPEMRVAVTMTVAQTNVGSSPFLPNSGGIQGAVNDLVRTRPTFWSRLQKGRTNLNPYVWANKTNKQGNAAFIGEGVLKPLASFEITVETSSAKKVAERFRVSTELLNDIEGIQSLIENEARFEVETAANTAVLTGTASSTSPAGVTTIASAFTLTTIEVEDPNNFDAIRAAIAQLTSLNFDRDIVAFMNPIDVANMELSKGTDGHYLLPPFTSADGTTIKGVTVIEDNNIAVGNLLIGDMTKYKILMVEDFVIKWGYDSDDFSKNLITMIAEMRFHQFVSANHTGAFIYDSFADIKTAIAAA